MNVTDLLLLALGAPFGAALLSPWIYRKWGRKTGLIVPLAGSLLSFLSLLTLAHLALQKRSPSIIDFKWVESINLGFTFVCDGFGLLFALLVSGIGVLIVLYAHHYMEHEPLVGRFYSFLLFFMGAMLGVCLSEHLFTLFLFWELTSLSSYLLIGFWHEKEKSRAGALKALVITSGGGLSLMAGLALLGGKTGFWTWTQLSAVSGSFLNQPWVPFALILILIGAFTKSAQSPFHIWLPDAMEAPTPVSAFLHSATMVKAGIILIFRLYPIFSAHPLWFPVLSAVGMTTVVVGAVLALKHTDLKAILAYSTISQLGLFVVMQGYAAFSPILIAGLIFHIFAHAFYKGGLFMLTGIIDHATHTRDIQRLGQLKQWMPKTAVFFMLACGSLAGLPPFLGFISKEAALEATLALVHDGRWGSPFLLIALVFSATCTVAVAGKLALGVFWAKPDDPQHLQAHPPHEVSWGLLTPPALIASFGLVFGLMPFALENLLYPLAMIGLSEYETPHFSLWHGFSLALLLSTVAIGGGAALYKIRGPLLAWQSKAKLSWNLNTLYEKKWDVILDLARRLTERFQNGSLSWYVGVTVAFIGGVLGFTLVSKPDWSQMSFDIASVFSYEGLVAIGIALFSLMVALLKDRIARLVSLGGVGLFICTYFILRGAPDLALTGFLVEIVMFILILIVFKQLPEETTEKDKPGTRFLKGGLATLAGCTVGALCFVVLKVPLGDSISPYFIDYADLLAGGLNIVNVIVVDFRGFDTMGEIAVLCLAGMGVFGLRKVWSQPPSAPSLPLELKRRPLEPSQILHAVSAWAVPLTLVFSLYMFYRGHNQPGGGFIGGLITAGALVLEMVTVGRNRFLKRFSIQGRTLFGVGLALAFVTGLVPLLLGYPFLTSYVIRSIHFSTATLFDLGVYLVVVGVTIEMLMLIEEGERSETV